MTEKEMLKVQEWMLLAEKESNVYKSLRIRYVELKVLLMVSGVNLTELDRIKE